MEKSPTVACIHNPLGYELEVRVCNCSEAPDMVNHPPHYNSHPSGVECVRITEHFTFCLGNVIKYVWRAGEKGNALEDLKKARFYLNREIERITKQA